MKEEYVGYYKRMVIKANKEVVSPIEACMLDKKEALKKQAEERLKAYENGVYDEQFCCDEDIRKALKKQAKKIREWVAIHKEVICEYSTNYFLKAFDENFLKQQGGKGIKPKGK